MLELTTTAEKKAQEALVCKAFMGIDLSFIKSKVSEIIGQIGRNGIFHEYTKHDISHIDKVLKSLEWIIPEETTNIMTKGEWLMITLSIYFHDLGMIVTQEEYTNRALSGFTSYKEFIYKDAEEDFISKLKKMDDSEKFLYQEFVRSKHAERINKWILGKKDNELGYCGVIVDEIDKMFINLDQEFRRDLGMICESHHLYDLDNINKYEIDHYYGSDEDEKVNLHYCAIILRTADLLHVTSDRTPSTEFRLINPSDPISQQEWAKQMAVKNIGMKKMRDEEGNVDTSIQSNTIEITASFKGANSSSGFFGLSSYGCNSKSFPPNNIKQNILN